MEKILSAPIKKEIIVKNVDESNSDSDSEVKKNEKPKKSEDFAYYLINERSRSSGQPNSFQMAGISEEEKKE